jgi:hypothetical protein
VRGDWLKPRLALCRFGSGLECRYTVVSSRTTDRRSLSLETPTGTDGEKGPTIEWF